MVYITRINENNKILQKVWVTFLLLKTLSWVIANKKLCGNNLNTRRVWYLVPYTEKNSTNKFLGTENMSANSDLKMRNAGDKGQ